MTETLDERALELAVEAALKADVIPSEKYPGYGVKLSDYIECSAANAVELGIHLTEKTKDGQPRYHFLSDIRGDEYADALRAIIEPVVTAAIIAYRASEASPINPEEEKPANG